MQELRVIPVPLSGDVRAGDSIADKFLDALQRTGLSLTKGDILVVKAGEVHKFVNIGDVPLVHLDVHLNERFIQENLD